MRIPHTWFDHLPGAKPIDRRALGPLHSLGWLWPLSRVLLLVGLVSCSSSPDVIEDHRLGSGAPVVRSPSQDEGSVRAQSKDASSANGEVRDAVSGSRLSVEPDASPPRPIGADEDLGPMNVDGNLRVDPFPDPFADTIQEEIDDPWEAFNSTMFTFNRNVDRFALKPAATAYEFVTPDFLERGVRNAFHNFGVVSRVVNNLLQGKFEGAGLEFSRFMINSTLGIAGLMDVAKDYFDMETPDEDLGQTLSVYGTPPGPYLVLPFMPPFTVRDAGGYVVDGLMNPANWLLPIFPTLIGMNGGEVVNDRSLNLERYEGVEEGTVDLYGAVRDAYKQKRAQAIKE